MSANQPARVAGVHVHDEKTGLAVFYDVDDEVAPEHVDLIGDHVWTSGKRPSAARASDNDGPPAKSAVKAEHLAYAQKVGAEIDGKPVTEDAKVEDIIKAYESKAGAGGSGA